MRGWQGQEEGAGGPCPRGGGAGAAVPWSKQEPAPEGEGSWGPGSAEETEEITRRGSPSWCSFHTSLAARRARRLGRAGRARYKAPHPARGRPLLCPLRPARPFMASPRMSAARANRSRGRGRARLPAANRTLPQGWARAEQRHVAQNTPRCWGPRLGVRFCARSCPGAAVTRLLAGAAGRSPPPVRPGRVQLSRSVLARLVPEITPGA